MYWQNILFCNASPSTPTTPMPISSKASPRCSWATKKPEWPASTKPKSWVTSKHRVSSTNTNNFFHNHPYPSLS